MRYLSICSGIEAATVAWHPLGWTPAAFSEIDAFPRALLKIHYPDVPLHGRDRLKDESFEDYAAIAGFQTIEANQYGPIDLLVGGTPCQSFSVAGLRGGLDDDRGNLALEFLRLAKRKRPKWCVWENVPGVLSSKKGRDFGSILGGLAELGYGFAYRVLDAQYCRVDGYQRAVPQRRRRVFVVGYLGDWRPAAAVLFERESLSGNPAPRRETGQGFAADVVPSLTGSGRGIERAGETRGQDPVVAVCGGGPDNGRIAGTVSSKWAKGSGGPAGDECYNMVTHALRGEGFDASEDGTGRGTPIVPVASTLKANNGGGGFGSDPSETFIPIAFDCKASGRNGFAVGEVAPTLRAMGSKTSNQNAGGQVATAYPIQEVGKRTGKSTTDKRAGIGIGNDDDPMFTLQAGAQHGVFTLAVRGREGGHNLEYRDDGTANAVLTPNGGRAGIGVGAIAQAMAVRRLTPKECERLQGFPDEYTNIPWRGKNDAPDGLRYKALGNSMAVNVMRWIGTRINAVEAILKEQAA